jgi:hypothetical protein
MKYHLGLRYFSFVENLCGLRNIKATLLLLCLCRCDCEGEEAQWGGDNRKQLTIHKEAPEEIA